MSVRRFLALLVAIAVGLGTLVLIADVWLLPWIIHQQNEVLVPDLVGLSREEAERKLTDLRLRVTVGEEVFDESLPPGAVLEQSPSALTPVRNGRPVRLVLSKGEALSRVPDLTGLSLRQCELSLMREGLSVGRVSRPYDPTGRIGVVSQRPHAGQEVRRGEGVSLLLREGHQGVYHRMPRLVGQNLNRVREGLARAGFDIKRVTYRADRELPGTILDQWPPPGARISAGGSVELVAASRG